MRFDADHAHALAAGRVTELRLPTEARPPRVGKTVAVTSYGVRRPIGHVQVVKCSRAPHGPSLTDLLALGHDTLEGYVRAWLLRRDMPWLARRATEEERWFDGIPEAAEKALGRLAVEPLLERFRDRWAPVSVWVVLVQPEHDLPVFLRAGPPRLPFATRPSGRQMVDDGIRDEDRGWYGKGVRPVPAHTELADRGLVEGAYGGATGVGEYVDPKDLAWHWRGDADDRHGDAQSPHDEARRLAKRLRAA